MTIMRIPQANPGANYRAHASVIEAAVHRVLSSGTYLSGAETKSFEAELASFLGVKDTVGASSGTDALWLALRACGIGHGDEVITVSHTAVATVAAIELCSATPILVDIDAHTFTLDPQQLEAALSPRTRAVVPVHLYGQAANLDPIVGFCRQHDLWLVEDCAQAAGAFYRDRRVGSVGDAAAFSFYPTKNLAALGDAGAVATSEPQLASAMRALREYGWRDAQRLSEQVGRNARLDEIQAAVLGVKLPYLDEDNRARRRLADLYKSELADCASVTLPFEPEYGRSVFHQYVIRTQKRDSLEARLRAAGVTTAVHYPVPVHLQPAYLGRGLTRPASGSPAESLPETVRAASEVLSLPMFPELEHSAVREIAAIIRQHNHQGA
jgi:dTDP-4-amino-4,6-dideoxygalactose transaminase